MPSTLLLARDFANSHSAVVASRPLLNHIGPRSMQTPIKVTRTSNESLCSLSPDMKCRISPVFEFVETNIRSAMPILKHCSVARGFQSSLAIVTNEKVSRDTALYKQFVELLSGGGASFSCFQHLDSLLLRVSLKRGISPGATEAQIPVHDINLPTNLPSLRRLFVKAGGKMCVGPSTLKQIASNFTGLTHLDLHLTFGFAGAPKVRDDQLGGLFSALVNLRALRLHMAHTHGESASVGDTRCFIDKVTPRLQHLALHALDVYSSLVATRHLSNGLSTTPLAEYLARARELEYFEIGSMPTGTTWGSCRKLFQPELITNSTSGDASAPGLFNISHLIFTSEFLDNIDFLRFFPTLLSCKAQLAWGFNAASIVGLAEFPPNLAALDLSRSPAERLLTEELVERLSPSLRSLCLRGAVKAQVQSLHLLSRLHNLTALDITDFGGGWGSYWKLKTELPTFRLPPRLEVFDCKEGMNIGSSLSAEVFVCLKNHPLGLLRHVRLLTSVKVHESVLREWCGPNAELEFA